MAKQPLSKSAIARYSRQRWTAVQKQAQRDWERSPVGGAIKDVARMGRAIRHQKTPDQRARKAVQKLSRLAGGGAMKQIAGSIPGLNDMVRAANVAKYGLGDGILNTMLSGVLSKMFGPLGGSLAQIVFAQDDADQGAQTSEEAQQQAAEDSLRAALEFINLVDPELLSGKGKETLTGTPEAAGLTPADEDEDNQYLQASAPISGREGFYVNIYEGGRLKSYARTDPIITGEMVPVQSSNVPGNNTIQISDLA
ncbi:hypothetical protein K0U83_21435, partial [bacterium]|nr:hypothetical protein [bacterium]